MDLSARLLRQVAETKYLSVDNAWRYRSIIRFFYLEYEKMNYWLYKEDVFGELSIHEEFAGYNMDMCKQDLESLSEWGNIVPVQDTSKALTIEEFKNKQFRYQLSEYSVEIERMVMRLENLRVENASLEPTLLERLRTELEKFISMSQSEPEEAGVWWRSLSEDFRRLNQNYQDYIRELCSFKAEELMKSREFLVFKDRFIEYIRNFVKGLQSNSYAIEAYIATVDIAHEELLFEKVLSYEKSVPRIEQSASDDEIMDNITGKWGSMKRWFVGAGALESEASKLFEMTNDIIRKITRYACQIVETQNSAANRKKEYRKLCSMFLECDNMDIAHCISACTFGVFRTRHIKGDFERTSESVASSVYDEPPHEVVIKPRLRTYKERLERLLIGDNSDRKKLMRERIIQRRQEEMTIMESYVKDGIIEFEKLPCIEPHVRKTLLKWVGKAGATHSKRAKTDDGRGYTLMHPKDGRMSVIRCTDGEFETPAYIIRFEGDENEGT